LTGENVSALNPVEDEGIGGMGQKIKARSSSPPETAKGGLGNNGWRDTENVDCPDWCNARMVFDELPILSSTASLTAHAPAVVLPKRFHIFFLSRPRTTNDDLSVISGVVLIVIIHGLVALILMHLNDVVFVEIGFLVFGVRAV